jgi:DNA-binding protein H-NS
MAKSLAQLLKQKLAIDKLIAAQQREKQHHVARIQKEIQKLGLTQEDLFGEGRASKSSSAPKVASQAKKKSASAPKFQNKDGLAWSGKGPRPHWLRAALEGGAALEDFAVGAQTRGPAKSAAKPKKTAATKPQAKAKATRQAAPAKRGKQKVANAKPAGKSSARKTASKSVEAGDSASSSAA